MISLSLHIFNLFPLSSERKLRLDISFDFSSDRLYACSLFALCLFDLSIDWLCCQILIYIKIKRIAIFEKGIKEEKEITLSITHKWTRLSLFLSLPSCSSDLPPLWSSLTNLLLNSVLMVLLASRLSPSLDTFPSPTSARPTSNSNSSNPALIGITSSTQTALPPKPPKSPPLTPRSPTPSLKLTAEIDSIEILVNTILDLLHSCYSYNTYMHVSYTHLDTHKYT